MHRKGHTYLRNPRTLLPAQLVRLVHEHVRADGDVLGVGAAVREPEDGVPLLKTALAVAAELLDRAAEFDTQRLGGLGRDRIHALALQQVHAVQTEGFDFDEGLGTCRLGTRGLVVDEEVRDRAFAVFDVCVVWVKIDCYRSQ